MRIADMLARSKPSVSFEFMAPRDESEVETLERTIAALAGHAPDWVSVTYRVRTGEKTLDLVTRIKRHYHIEAMAHLTCANTADRTRQILNWMEREGVANVLALRGDVPTAGEPFIPADPQLAHGSDLIALVRRSGYRFGIGAACSTEKHPESPDVEHEFRYMRLKVESGADFLITQLFFDNKHYFDLVARAREAGIKVERRCAWGWHAPTASWSPASRPGPRCSARRRAWSNGLRRRSTGIAAVKRCAASRSPLRVRSTSSAAYWSTPPTCPGRTCRSRLSSAAPRAPRSSWPMTRTWRGPASST